MLVSTPPLSSHQLANNLPSASPSNSSLPASFPITMTNNNNSSSLTTNPCDWSVNQVEEWLMAHNLHDCTNLICHQYRMDGRRLMNLKEDYVLQLKGTTKNKELWIQIQRLQQLYSSNYHLWTNRSAKPMTASSYFLPSSLLQRPIPLRHLQPVDQIRPPCHSTITFHQNINQNQPHHVFLPPVQQEQQQQLLQQQQQQQQKQQQQQQQQQPSSPATTIILERPSSLTVTRSTSSNNLNEQNHRPLSRSLSTSNTSIEGPSPASSLRATNQSLTGRRSPEDPLEDLPTVGCCFVGSIRSDRKKTLTAFLLALSTIYFCSFSITVVDERLPDPRQYPPLPDLILENIPHWPWGFAVTEKLIVIEMLTLVTVIIFHRHRLIILRRLFAIAAALYFLRSLTMVFTSLPVATLVTDCRPEKIVHFGARLKKATFIFLGQGMSSFGVKTCGDYLYSGHTCTLVLATHFINESTYTSGKARNRIVLLDSPRSYRILHVLTWIMAITGMFFILAGRQHYSIDILIAWVLASRLFIYYHTLANIQTFSPQDLKRMRIWFPFFTYFEENVKKKIPNEYCLPAALTDAIATLNTCLSPARYPTD